MRNTTKATTKRSVSVFTRRSHHAHGHGNAAHYTDESTHSRYSSML